MTRNYVPQTGDIVTLNPNALYKGRLTEALETIIAGTNPDYKWIVNIRKPYLMEQNQNPPIAIYSLLERNYNDGVFVDKEFLTLVTRIDKPLG